MPIYNTEVVAVLPCLVALITLAQGQAEDRKLLTQGVGELVTQGGIPGAMVASGSPAFVVITGHSGGARVPVFVAANVGKGRAMAGGHEVFFGAPELKNAANRRFFTNSLVWLGHKPPGLLHVGFLGMSPPQEYLRSLGVQPFELNRGNLPDRLPDIEVICLTQGALDGDYANQAKVVEFLRNGGGVMVLGPAWGWQQLSPGKSLTKDHSGNRMLGDFGIHFASQLVDGPFIASDSANPELTTFGALDVLQKSDATKPQIQAALASLDRALAVGTDDDPGLPDQISELAKKEAGSDPTPTTKNPANLKTPMLRLQAALDVKAWRSTQPEAIAKYPSADDFPGGIPAGTKRAEKKLSIYVKTPGWHATGMYAAPGEVVTVTIPDDARTTGLEVRVGPQTDQLWHLDSWARFPQISMLVPITKEETKFASPFGGLIYIVSPRDTQSASIPIKIANAIPAPIYQVGENPENWSEEQLKPAPWVDLVGRHISLSLPHAAVTKLKDPAPLMAYWDEVFKHACELYAVPEGNRQERYCVDRQIGGGYMHSGYPIMTHEDVAETFADVAKLRSKGGPTWGFYHELGHNFQQSDWTFAGCGEVTNNLFSLYGNEMLNGITPETYVLAHPALDPKEVRSRLTKYLDAGAPFSQWMSEPFLALTMYIQLRVAFGWDAFKHVFAEYRDLRDSERPKNDDQKRDQWMVRFSRQVRKNLGPFFVAWGVPTSASARQSIADLPAWMPADWPKKTESLSLELEPSGAASPVVGSTIHHVCPCRRCSMPSDLDATLHH